MDTRGTLKGGPAAQPTEVLPRLSTNVPGGDYGQRRRFDFFVEHLLGVGPPDWNAGVRLARGDAAGR